MPHESLLNLPSYDIVTFPNKTHSDFLGYPKTHWITAAMVILAESQVELGINNPHDQRLLHALKTATLSPKLIQLYQQHRKITLSEVVIYNSGETGYVYSYIGRAFFIE